MLYVLSLFFERAPTDLKRIGGCSLFFETRLQAHLHAFPSHRETKQDDFFFIIPAEMIINPYFSCNI